MARGFRTCCDTPAQRHQEHLRGCRYRLDQRIQFGTSGFIPCTADFVANEAVIAQFDGADLADLHPTERSDIKSALARREELVANGHRGDYVAY